MPTNHKDGESGNTSRKSASRAKTSPNISFTVNTGENQTHSVNTQSEIDQDHRIEVNVNIPRDEKIQETDANTIAKRANLITNRSTIINAGLLAGTIILAVIAIWQYGSSKSAAEIAQKTLDETKKYNREVFKRQDSSNRAQAMADSIKFRRDTVAFNTSFKLQKKGVQAQIDAFKETQKEFAISNEPYLQIVNAKIDSFVVGKPIKIMFDIQNIGNYPVKVIDAKTVTAIRISNPGMKDPVLNDSKGTNIINVYIVKGDGQRYLTYTDNVLNQAQFYAVVHDKYYVWCTGIIKFKNIITNQIKTYIFSIKIKPNQYGMAVTNDNVIDFSKKFK